MEIPAPSFWLPVALLLFGWVFYKYLTWNHDYWKKRGVPYVKPAPVFGNLKDAMLVKKSLAEVYQDLYWKLDGYSFGGIFKFGEPAILVRDPELIKNILVRDFTSFHDNNIHVDLNTDPMFGRNPFVLPGESWKIARTQLMPAFTQVKLKPLFPLVDEVCRRLIEHLERECGSGEIETKELCARFTTDVVASCAFGIEGNAIRNANSEFRLMGKDMLEPTFFSNMKIIIVLFLPWIADLFKIRFISKKVENFFRRIVEEVVSYREVNNVSRADYMQHLIMLKDKGIANENNRYATLDKNLFTDEDVAAQAITFFGDGFETSSGTMSFALYALAVHPDVQIKVREEVKSVLNKYGGKLTFDGIQEMKYLDMVLAESMRMYTVVTYMIRECTRPFKMETPSGSHFTIEVGTPVVVPVYAIHHDPQNYPNPQHFDPERFTEENKKNRHKYIYLPFGEGPRICLGFRFALMQVKAGIASVISNFELRATPRTPVPIVQDPSYFLLAAKGGLWIQFHKRK